MSINNTLLKTRIAKRIIPFLDEGVRKKYNIKNEYSFGFIVHFLMQKFNLSINEAITCVTDGSNDNGIDAIHIDDGLGEIHMIQSEFLQNTGKTALGENKIRLTLASIINIMDGKVKVMNPFLASKIENIDNLCKSKDDGIQMNVHFITNTQFSVNKCENVECLNASNRGYSVHWHEIADIIGLETEKNQKLTVNIRVKSEKYSQASDVGNLRGIVATISATELLKIYKNGGHEHVFEHNIRNYLGSKPINKIIYNTAIDPINSKYFWFFNNGISLICEKYTITDNAIGQKNIRLDNPKIINGGQTTKTLIELENHLKKQLFNDFNDENSKILENVEILIRIYETDDAELIKQITIGTNTQNAISKQDLQANNDISKSVQSFFEANQYGLEIKKNEYNTGTKIEFRKTSKYIALQNEVLQFYVSTYKERPEKAYISKAQIFSDYFETIFSQSNVSLPQEYFRAFEIGYFVQNQIKHEEISNGNSFLANCSLFMMFVLTQIEPEIKNINKDFSTFNLQESYVKSKEIIKQLVVARRKREEDLYSNNKYFKTEECKKDFIIFMKNKSKIITKQLNNQIIT